MHGAGRGRKGLGWGGECGKPSHAFYGLALISSPALSRRCLTPFLAPWEEREGNPPSNPALGGLTLNEEGAGGRLIAGHGEGAVTALSWTRMLCQSGEIWGVPVSFPCGKDALVQSRRCSCEPAPSETTGFWNPLITMQIHLKRTKIPPRFRLQNAAVKFYLEPKMTHPEPKASSALQPPFSLHLPFPLLLLPQVPCKPK